MTSDNSNTRLTSLCAILLFAAIVSTVLFSGSESGSKLNFAVTALFVCTAMATAVIEKRPFRFTAEVVILSIWLCYSLLPSMTATSLDLAFSRTQQMIQIIILVILSINVMNWYGRTEIFAFAYGLSGVLTYVATLAGFGFGIIDVDTLQELNDTDRVVGPHGNANKYGIVLLQAQLATGFLATQAKTVHSKVAAALAIAVLSIAIINTGSRTAFIGMIFFLMGLIWVYRVWRIRSMVQALLIIVAFGLIGTGTYHSLDEDDEVKIRLDSYLENEQLMARYKNMFRLFVSSDKVDNSAEGSMSHRAQLIEGAWKAANDAPLGLGLDNFRVLSNSYAHSNYFELLATTGFIGILLYLAIYVFMLARLLKFVGHKGGFTVPMRLFAVAVSALMITDLANVSYYSKAHWLLLALAIATAETWNRTAELRLAERYEAPKLN